MKISLLQILFRVRVRDYRTPIIPSVGELYVGNTAGTFSLGYPYADYDTTIYNTQTMTPLINCLIVGGGGGGVLQSSLTLTKTTTYTITVGAGDAYNHTSLIGLPGSIN